VLVLQGVFSLNHFNSGTVTTTLLFLAVFECSPGPILFIYASDIMTDLGLSLALFINFAASLIVSIITPWLVNSIGQENIGYIFLVMGVLSLTGLPVMLKFLKETRGKSRPEIDEMFVG
jgi:hypothetical protein